MMRIDVYYLIFFNKGENFPRSMLDRIFEIREKTTNHVACFSIILKEERHVSVLHAILYM